MPLSQKIDSIRNYIVDAVKLIWEDFPILVDATPTTQMVECVRIITQSIDLESSTVSLDSGSITFLVVCRKGIDSSPVVSMLLSDADSLRLLLLSEANPGGYAELSQVSRIWVEQPDLLGDYVEVKVEFKCQISLARGV